MQAQRNERESLLDDGTDQFTDFMAVEQEFTFSQRLMIGAIAMRVRPDVHSKKPGFAPLDRTIGVVDVHGTRADRFDFGALQDDSRVKLLEEFIVAAGVFVVADMSFC